MEFACPVSVYLPPPLPRKAPQLCSENCSNSLVPSGVKSWWDCSSRSSPWGWVSGALFWEGEPWAQRPRLGRAETGRDQGWLSICTFSLGPQSCSFLTPPFQHISSASLRLFLKHKESKTIQLPNKPQTTLLKRGQRWQKAMTLFTSLLTELIIHSTLCPNTSQ